MAMDTDLQAPHYCCFAMTLKGTEGLVAFNTFEMFAMSTNNQVRWVIDALSGNNLITLAVAMQAMVADATDPLTNMNSS